MIWTARQRAALICVIAVLLSGLSARYLLNHSQIADPQPDLGRRAAELADRIDPNTADWQTLAALPLIGQSMAQRIVDERQTFLANHPEPMAYTKIEDLLRVKGIGEATIRTIEPYLIFPPTTQPTGEP
jgi:hypothetical protein